MQSGSAWFARWWFLYLLAGVVWVTLGALVFGDPQGLGLIFIGLACLAFSGYGANWLLSHGYRLTRPLPPRSRHRA